MLGSEILEIAIGIVFTFLLLSLTASTVRESAEGLLKTRAIQLERGLREMLDDPEGIGITKQLFDHPLLYGLFPGNYNPKQQLRTFIFPRKTLVAAGDGTTSEEVKNPKTRVAAGDGTTSKEPKNPKTHVAAGDCTTSEEVHKRIKFHSNLPAYIPSRNFAMALLDLASKKNGSAVLSLEAVRQTAVTLQNRRLQSALLVAIGEAEGDIDRARTSLEAWFDGTMDRVSGWYKRETQWVLLALGLFLAVALNVDCLHVARSLALNNSLRQKIVQSVEAEQHKRLALSPDAATIASQKPGQANSTKPSSPALSIPPGEVDAQLSGLSEIIGWGQFKKSIDEQVAKDNAAVAKIAAGTAVAQNRRTTSGLADDWWATCASHVLLSIPGWLISAFAVSLGAPFWFDVLNKLMIVRSTVKPYQKSPSEGSDDRKPGVSAANLLAPQPAKAVNAGSPPQVPVAGPDTQAATVAIRLAFDTAVSPLADLRLVVDGGDPQDVSSDHQVEINVAANVPHTLTATATAAGTALSWSDSIMPGLDDDGWPILATLA